MNRATSLSVTLILILLAVMFQANANAEGSFSTSAQKWSFATDSRDTTIYDIAQANGLVYYTSGPGTSPENFYCLNAETGRQIWNYSSSYIYFTVSGSRILIRSGAIAEGVLLCFDMATGVKLWQNTLNGKFMGSLMVANNTIFVTAGNAIYTIDEITGKTDWWYGISAGNFETLFVGDGYVFVVSDSKNELYPSAIYNLNASTGQKIWTTEILNYTALESGYSSFSIVNDEILVSQKVPTQITVPNNQEDTGSVLSFDIYNGTLLWNYTTPGLGRDFAVVNDTVYSATNSGAILAVNASNGNILWVHKDNLQYGSIFISNGYLYVSSSQRIACFYTANGHVIWNYQAHDFDTDSSNPPAPTNPTFSEGIVYFGWNGPQGWVDTTEHNFYALNANNGTVIWKYPLSYTIQATPAIVNNTLFIGCSEVSTGNPTGAGPDTVIALNTNAIPTSNPTPVNSLLPLALIVAAIIILFALATFVLRKKFFKRHFD